MGHKVWTVAQLVSPTWWLRHLAAAISQTGTSALAFFLRKKNMRHMGYVLQMCRGWRALKKLAREKETYANRRLTKQDPPSKTQSFYHGWRNYKLRLKYLIQTRRNLISRWHLIQTRRNLISRWQAEAWRRNIFRTTTQYILTWFFVEWRRMNCNGVQFRPRWTTIRRYS